MLLLPEHPVLPCRPLEICSHFVLISSSLLTTEHNCPREQANVYLKQKTLVENRRRELWPEKGIKRLDSQALLSILLRACTLGRIFLTSFCLSFWTVEWPTEEACLEYQCLQRSWISGAKCTHKKVGLHFLCPLITSLSSQNADSPYFLLPPSSLKFSFFIVFPPFWSLCALI